MPRFLKFTEKAAGRVHSNKMLSFSTERAGTEVTFNPDSVKATVESEVAKLEKNWRSDDTDLQYTIDVLTSELLAKDHEWLIEPKGRNKDLSEHYNPDKDPFLSHLVYYGLLGHTTGNKDYDEMFRSIVKNLRSEFDRHNHKLMKIISIWNEKHPSMQFNLESLFK